MNIERVFEIFRETGVMLDGHFLFTSGRHGDKYMQCAQLFRFPQYTDAVSYTHLDAPVFLCASARGFHQSRPRGRRRDEIAKKWCSDRGCYARISKSCEKGAGAMKYREMIHAEGRPATTVFVSGS